MRDLYGPIIFFFLCLFLFTKFVGPVPFSVNSVPTTKTSLFQAEGTGEATAVPDTALINMGVSTTGSSVIQAQQNANTIINKMTSDLKNLGIEEKDIKTTNYSVGPNTTLGSVANGFLVNETITVKVTPIGKANQAMDIATKDGVNVVSGPSFILNDTTQKNLEQQARNEAVKNAKEKAESLAKAAGIHLGKVVDVQESNGRGVLQALPLAAGEKTTNSTQLNPGENTITSTVTLSYETF